MADGYGFGAEGDWKTRRAGPHREGDERPASTGGTSFMEDYTYHLEPGGPKVLGAHMLEVCPSIAADKPSCEIHPLSIGARPIRSGSSSRQRPGRPSSSALLDLGNRFRLVANEVEVVAGRRGAAASAGRASDLEAEARASQRRPRGGSRRRAPPHELHPGPRRPRLISDFAEIAGVEIVVIDERTTVSGLKKELRWNHAYYHLARGL